MSGLDKVSFFGGGSGSFSIPAKYIFTGADKAACETARDAYFTANPSELKKDVNVVLDPADGSGPYLQQYNGTSWDDISKVIQGPPIQDVTTVSSIPLKSDNGFVDSSLKNYIPQGESDPIIDSSAPWYQGSVDDTKDTPIFIYRGNGQQPPSDDWGASAIGVYQGGSYAIFNYFNKNGDNYGLYINKDGLNIKNGGSQITKLSDAIKNVEIGKFETQSTQNPSSTGDAGKIRVNFGAGGLTSSGEMSLSPEGVITCNTSNIQYVIEITVRIGRVGGGAGVSILHGRLMYAEDGVESNAVQVGSTSTTELDDADTIWREIFELSIEPALGSKFWAEFARDESGNNSGGILTQQPTASLSGWNQSSSAAVTFYRIGIL